MKKPKLTVPTTNLNMVTQLCQLLDIVMGDSPRMSDPQLLEATFIFCTVWSIGANIVQVSDLYDGMCCVLCAVCVFWFMAHSDNMVLVVLCDHQFSQFACAFACSANSSRLIL